MQEVSHSVLSLLTCTRCVIGSSNTTDSERLVTANLWNSQILATDVWTDGPDPCPLVGPGRLQMFSVHVYFS